MNIQNRSLFHGDNLGFLRGIDTETIDLIATDPPFNKGKDFHATPDSLAAGSSFQDRWSWDKDVHPAWIDHLKDDFPEIRDVVESARSAHSDGMGAFMCFMAVRLLEMRRILKPTGSLYLHCDPTASHYLKTVMDAIFGAQNFRNEIVWRIGWVSGYKTQKRGWIRNHDILLYYAMSNEAADAFNKEFLPYPDGYRRRDGKLPKGKGVPIEDTWNCNPADSLDSIMIKSFSKEKTGYATQKPLALYERIIRASSNPGEFVLDPFCGCATTLVAAERLGRQWAGIDLWEKAYEMVIERLKQDAALQAPDGTAKDMFPNGKIGYFTEPPERTDDGQEAATPLKAKFTRPRQEPSGERLSRDEMLKRLLEQEGATCQGCNRVFDDPRYLQLDHNTPRADGGINHISNRVLLCGPCNQLKSNLLTLSGLRRENEKRGHMR